jgi:hypothetical protein
MFTKGGCMHAAGVMPTVAASVERAQFWIDHDKARSAKMPRPPQYLE